MRDAAPSVNERHFIVKALQGDARVDGRRPFDSRELSLQILRDGAAEVQLGDTRVFAVANGELAAPFPDRPSEGQFALGVEFSPMASPEFEPGRGTDAAVELSRFLERGLKQSGAVDLEALVVQPGRWAWSIRVDVHVLDYGGSAASAASTAAMAALLTHRRPEVTLNPATGALEMHATAVREALSLSIHHVPLVTTFAFFENEAQHGELLVVMDPTVLEEKTCDSIMLVMMNAHKDVCGVQKAGGVGVLPHMMLSCMREAATVTMRLNAALRTAVKKHDQERVASRVRRHVNMPADGPPPARPVVPPTQAVPVDPNVSATLCGVNDDDMADGPARPVEDGACPTSGWDMAEAGEAFPFRGPLHPDRVMTAADTRQGDEEADGVEDTHGDAHHAQGALEEDDGVAPTSLHAAVKPHVSRRRGRRT